VREHWHVLRGVSPRQESRIISGARVPLPFTGEGFYSFNKLERKLMIASIDWLTLAAKIFCFCVFLHIGLVFVWGLLWAVLWVMDWFVARRGRNRWKSLLAVCALFGFLGYACVIQASSVANNGSCPLNLRWFNVRLGSAGDAFAACQNGTSVGTGVSLGGINPPPPDQANMRLQYSFDCGATWTSFGGTGPDSGSYNLFCGTPTTNCPYTIPIHNGDQYMHYYLVFHNGVQASGPIWVNSGATFPYTVFDPHCDFSGWSVMPVVDGSPIFSSPPSTNTVPGVGGSDPGGSITGPVFGNPIPVVPQVPPSGGGSPGGGSGGNDGGPPIQPYQPPTDGGGFPTNGPIQFPTNGVSGGTNSGSVPVTEVGFDALDTAIVQGDRAIVDAVNQAKSVIASHVDGAGSNILFSASGINFTMTNGLGGLLFSDFTNQNAHIDVLGTNLVRLTGTNASGFSTLHTDLTNLFGRMTNTVGATNWDGLTNISTGPGGYVMDDLTARGNTVFGDVNTTLDDMASAVSGVQTPSGGDGPLEANISAGVASFSISTSSSPFQSLWNLVRTLWTYLLVVGYAQRILVELQHFFESVSKAKGVSTQDLNIAILGSGGNAAGSVLASLVITLVLALWATFLALAMSKLLGVLSWASLFATLTGDPLGLMEGPAKQFLFACFPVVLCFSLVTAFLVFKISMFKLAIMVNAVMKMMLGS
jgi:hypothetical protein